MLLLLFQFGLLELTIVKSHDWFKSYGDAKWWMTNGLILPCCHNNILNCVGLFEKLRIKYGTSFPFQIVLYRDRISWDEPYIFI